MAFASRQWRLIAAAALAVMLIGGAYLLSGGSLPKTPSAEAAEAALLQAIATKDTDGDGLPDWEEALYGTDPTKASSNPYGVSDGEAFKKGLLTPRAPSVAESAPPDRSAGVPIAPPDDASLTNQFAQAMFTQYIQTSGGAALDPTTEDRLIRQWMQAFAESADTVLSSSYSRLSVKASPTVSLSSYASALEKALTAHDAGVSADSNEPIALIEALIERGDPAARGKLSALAAAYAAIATDIASVMAPTALVDDHLALLRSFDQLAKASGITAAYERDPLATFAAVTIYKPATAAIAASVGHIAHKLLDAGMGEAPGEPGALLLRYAEMTKQL